jgi:hypothetical protein
MIACPFRPFSGRLSKILIAIGNTSVGLCSLATSASGWSVRSVSASHSRNITPAACDNRPAA